MSGVIEQFPLEEEYKKKTQIAPADIHKLRQWVDRQPHLPAEYITDLDLILAYHCCNRSAEVAKQVLDLHYTLKTLFTTFFKERLVDDKILKALSNYVFETLKVRAYDGSAVIYTQLVNVDPKHFSISEAVRGFLMVIDLWQYAEGTWPGFTIVIDMSRVTLMHTTRLAQDLQAVQQFLYFLQEAKLLKVRTLHFYNAPVFMDRVMMIIKPFMKKELMQVVHIHPAGDQSINKFLPTEAFPTVDTYIQCRDVMIEKIKSNASFFVLENKKRVTESRRPGKPKTISDIFSGVEGSFKKLDID